jgi:hypothetical protein
MKKVSTIALPLLPWSIHRFHDESANSVIGKERSIEELARTARGLAELGSENILSP